MDTPITPPGGMADRIREIMADKLLIDASPEALGAEDDLVGEHGVDSVRLFDLVVGLEGEFGVQFEDNELVLANFATLAAIAARVSAKQGG